MIKRQEREEGSEESKALANGNDEISAPTDDGDKKSVNNTNDSEFPNCCDGNKVKAQTNCHDAASVSTTPHPNNLSDVPLD